MPPVPRWLFYGVTLLVIGLWAVGIVFSLFSRSFQMPASLNTVVPIVLVALYTGKITSDERKKRNDDGDGDDDGS